MITNPRSGYSHDRCRRDERVLPNGTYSLINNASRDTLYSAFDADKTNLLVRYPAGSCLIPKL